MIEIAIVRVRVHVRSHACVNLHVRDKVKVIELED